MFRAVMSRALARGLDPALVRIPARAQGRILVPALVPHRDRILIQARTQALARIPTRGLTPVRALLRVPILAQVRIRDLTVRRVILPSIARTDLSL
jgi:hypothetical protein